MIPLQHLLTFPQKGKDNLFWVSWVSGGGGGQASSFLPFKSVIFFPSILSDKDRVYRICVHKVFSQYYVLNFVISSFLFGGGALPSVSLCTLLLALWINVQHHNKLLFNGTKRSYPGKYKVQCYNVKWELKKCFSPWQIPDSLLGFLSLQNGLSWEVAEGS